MVKCLFINPMPPELMARLRELADEQSPKVSRNSLILWILEEFAAGNLVHKATLPAEPVLEKEVAA